MPHRTIRSIELAIFLCKQNKWEYRTIIKSLFSEWQQSAGISPGVRWRVRGADGSPALSGGEDVGVKNLKGHQ